jgi:RHS repeat-associated protein
VKTTFINDVGLGLVQVLMETDNAGVVQATYNYGNDLISMNRVGVNSYYHYDGLGTVKQLSDEAGAVVASYVYDSFGNSVSSVSSVANNYGFTGEQQFAEPDNLVFLRARYYSPQIGRFMSRDPILTPMQIESHVGWLLPYLNLIYKPQYLQPYVYALNAPINFSDPSGLSSFKECFLGCLDKMTGGITGTICAGYSGFGALIAAAAGSPTLAALLGAAPAWATGAVVGCSIGCGILELEWPPSTPPYPPPYYVWP